MKVVTLLAMTQNIRIFGSRLFTRLANSTAICVFLQNSQRSSGHIASHRRGIHQPDSATANYSQSTVHRASQQIAFKSFENVFSPDKVRVFGERYG